MSTEGFSNDLTFKETKRFLERRGYSPDTLYVAEVWQGLHSGKITADDIDALPWDITADDCADYPSDDAYPRPEDATEYTPETYLDIGGNEESSNIGGKTISHVDAERAVQRDAVLALRNKDSVGVKTIGRNQPTDRVRLMDCITKNLRLMGISTNDFMQKVLEIAVSQHTQVPTGLFEYCNDASREARGITKTALAELAYERGVEVNLASTCQRSIVGTYAGLKSECRR